MNEHVDEHEMYLLYYRGVFDVYVIILKKRHIYMAATDSQTYSGNKSLVEVPLLVLKGPQVFLV